VRDLLIKIKKLMVELGKRAWPVVVHVYRVLMILLIGFLALVNKILRSVGRRLIILLKIVIRKAKDWYWSLEPKRRHRVGWASVIVASIVIGASLWGITMGVIHAGSWVKEIFAGQTKMRSDLSDDELAIINLDEYSGSNRHRSFKCGPLDKKRKILLYKAFNDLNDAQLIAARRLGIAPIAKREDIDKKKSKLIHLKDTRYYKLDPMHHSLPYLVPDAADFLTALGERWQAYHGTNSRFIITSCLRTEKDIKRLRRGNVNATKDSCHRYGTTIDITYVRFDRHGRARDGKLKDDLARALLDMKEAGYCYVKYEYKQSCFHVTVRPR